MENIEKLAELAAALPEAFKKSASQLIEEMSTPLEGIGDEPVAWRPNFLRLVQGTTDRGSIPKGTSIGDFVLGERKLEQPLRFIPIRIWDSRQYWDPDQTNSKMLCWSPDAKFGHIGRECKGCPHAEWREEGGSDCGKSKSVLAISANLDAIFTVNFSKSNFKIGVELEGLMKRAAVAPYNRVYGLASATSSTAKNIENFKIEVLDEKLRRTSEELLPFLKELFAQVTADRKSTLEVFYEGALRKRDQLLLEAAANPKVETLTDQSGDKVADATVIVETPSGEAVSTAMKYSL